MQGPYKAGSNVSKCTDMVTEHVNQDGVKCEMYNKESWQNGRDFAKWGGTGTTTGSVLDGRRRLLMICAQAALKQQGVDIPI